MVASMTVYSTNTASTGNELKTEGKRPDGFIQMGPGGSATGYYDNNGKYHSGGYGESEAVNWFIENVQKPVLEYIADEGFHMGYSSNGDGTNGGLDVSVGPVSYNTNTGPRINPYIPTQQKAPNTTQAPGTPTAYSRSVARTAKDIAQGGMTKQEVQEFNMKHPNETAQRG